MGMAGIPTGFLCVFCTLPSYFAILLLLESGNHLTPLWSPQAKHEAQEQAAFSWTI